MFDLLNLKKKINKPTVLIVDDEPNILQALKDRLEINGYIVYTASNGKEGLILAIQLKPDIILLDIMMPVMDGHEMLANLRADPAGASLSVIMVTSKNDTEDVIRTKALGVDDYIVKPFDLTDLMGKMEKILERRRIQIR